MARKVQLRNRSGQKIYPITSSANVGMSDGSGSLDSHINRMTTEYNVSVFHPGEGIDGTNKYTLETAIAKIPGPVRNVGIKCSFLDDAGRLQTWEFTGGEWAASSFSQVGAGKLSELKNKLDTKISDGVYAIDINDLNGNNIQSKDDEIICSRQLEAFEVLSIFSMPVCSFVLIMRGS